jgi:endonuclease/exonuclease/phosphatase family metal-dependent hydrolase
MHIYCTHWGLNADERLVQAQECFGRLTRDAGDLSVICGDLNAEAPSPEVRRLVDSTGWSLADPSEASFPADLHRVRIDHIIVNSGVEIDSVTVIASGASDHFCVVARLAWTV